MRNTFRRSIALYCLAAMAATGCYSFEPVRMEQVTAGSIARARLDADEARRVAEVIGREDRVLEGEVLEADGDRLLMAVPMTMSTAGLSPRQFHQRVEVRRTAIIEVETRRFDALKTVLVLGGGAIIAGAAVAAAFAAADDPEGDDKPQPERIVVPIFRFE